MKRILAAGAIAAFVILTAVSALRAGAAKDARTAAPPAPDYAEPASWAALPDRSDGADVVPPGFADGQVETEADVFFIHPATGMDSDGSTVAADDPAVVERLDDWVLPRQASAFNGCCRVFAPRYRQAAAAASLDGWHQALDLPYGDVRRAFEHYLARMSDGRPFILAGHGQGSQHAMRLLHDVVEAEAALLDRLIAVYAIGSGVPLDVYDRDLETIKPCLTISDSRCVVSWNTALGGARPTPVSFGLHSRYADGEVEPIAGKALQCTNPLMWTDGDTPEWAPAELSRGALVGAAGDGSLPPLSAGEVAARCHDGVLVVEITEGGRVAELATESDAGALDYELFYADLRANAEARVRAHVAGAPDGIVVDFERTVPPGTFDEMPVPPAPDYANPISWAALPWRNDFADFAPYDSEDRQAEADVDVLFFSPTTFLFDEGWNGPIDHPVASARVDLGVLKYQASVFNGRCRVFAPRYRQATLATFRPGAGESGRKALDLAYDDVRRAFEHYIEHMNEGRPFFLAGHSQGSRHLIRLLGEVVAAHPARERMIAAYPVGAPLPLALYDDELEVFEPCRAVDDLGCIATWSTWGEGGPRPANRPKDMQCTNPLSWSVDGRSAPSWQHRGAIAGAKLHDPLLTPVPAMIGAQCRDGVLWADVPGNTRWEKGVMPPNNYHNLDYNLFYLDLRDNITTRADAFVAAREGRTVVVRERANELAAVVEAYDRMFESAEKGSSTYVAKRYDYGRLEAFLERELDRANDGLGLILFQDGEVVYRNSFGRWSDDRVVPIASASKWWSAAVLMSVVDDGLLNLDDRASRYLPSFTGDKATITIRQMFTHTSGIPGWPSKDRPAIGDLADAAREVGTRLALVAEPGEHFHYGNNGMQAVARIVEIVTGKSWADNFRERIAGPLGLSHTDYFAYGETPNPGVAGSMRSNLVEFGRFVLMLSNDGVHEGTRVLSPEAVWEMTANQHPDLPYSTHPWARLSDGFPEAADFHYSIGGWIEAYDTETNAGLEISSGGAFGANPWLDRGRDLAGVYLPMAHTMKRNSRGWPYNDASMLYLEMKEILEEIIPVRED